MSEAISILKEMNELGLFIVWHHAPPLGAMKLDFAELQTADGKPIERKTAGGHQASTSVPMPTLNELIVGGYVHRPLPITNGRSAFQITAKGRNLIDRS